MIEIKKSTTADTRTCDWSKVTEDQLLEASKQHIGDVAQGLSAFATMLLEAAEKHDHTKISHIKEFHDDFKTGFKTTYWWQMHQEIERHHFNEPKYIKKDINLLDVLEQITDGCMAGMARSGQYRQEFISPELLLKAYMNTVNLLLNSIKVVD